MTGGAAAIQRKAIAAIVNVRFAQAMIAYQMLYLDVFVVVVLFAAPPHTQ